MRNLTHPLIIAFLTLLSCQDNITEKGIVYLSPDCSCCHKWVMHMEENDFRLEENKDSDMFDIKTNAGVPEDFTSCHTAVIDGYFIEGHVPADDVKRLLKEKPDNIIGLTAPGMPAGINVPGMEVNDERASFDVLAINSEGESSVWKHHE